MILSGLLLGRWWRLSLVNAALGWPAALIATDVISVGPGLLGACGLAIANTGVGILIHHGVLGTIRNGRRDSMTGSCHGTWRQRQPPNARPEMDPDGGHDLHVPKWKRVLSPLAPQRKH